jgi:hypothetical protein
MNLSIEKRVVAYCSGGRNCGLCNNTSSRAIVRDRRLARHRVKALTNIEIDAGFDELENDAIEERDLMEKIMMDEIFSDFNDVP